MMPAVILRGPEQRERAIERLRTVEIKPEAREPWAMWLGPYRKIRTLAQNALYWRLVGFASAATGKDKEVLHEYFKRKAFGLKIDVVRGELVECAVSSAKVASGDFSELIEYVQWFLAEHAIEEAA